jgi:hypothetical protein
MDEISEVRVEELSESPWIRPFRMHYKQNGVQKSWDLAVGRPR